jgi:hypothetical protein
MRWRLLAHYIHPGGYGDPIDIRDHQYGPAQFDEFVVDHWLHIEQMSAHWWWMDVGGVQINIRVDKDGNATRVSIQDIERRDGCRYEGYVE